MAIAFVASNGIGTTTAATSITFAVDAGTGSDRVIVCGGQELSVDPGIASVTYAGAALTKHAEKTDTNVYVSLWRRVAPTTGSNNVVVTFAGSDQGGAGASVYTGVDQTTPLGTAATAAGSSTTPSVAVSSAAGELVVDVVGMESVSGGTPGTGQTERWDVDIGFGGAGCLGSEEAGAASVTMSWTILSSGWSIVGAPIKPVAGGTLSVNLAGRGGLAGIGGLAGQGGGLVTFS